MQDNGLDVVNRVVVEIYGLKVHDTRDAAPTAICGVTAARCMKGRIIEDESCVER